jgi:hypothetical protein
VASVIWKGEAGPKAPCCIHPMIPVPAKLQWHPCKRPTPLPHSDLILNNHKLGHPSSQLPGFFPAACAHSRVPCNCPYGIHSESFDSSSQQNQSPHPTLYSFSSPSLTAPCRKSRILAFHFPSIYRPQATVYGTISRKGPKDTVMDAVRKPTATMSTPVRPRPFLG